MASTEPKVFLTIDDEDILYADFSGEVEVQLQHSDCDKLMDEGKAAGKAETQQATLAIAMSMVQGWAEQMLPQVVRHVEDFYDIEGSDLADNIEGVGLGVEEAEEEVEEEADVEVEIMPGFLGSLEEEDLEE